MSDLPRALAELLASKREESAPNAPNPFLRDLTQEARNGRLSPVVGREAEIMQVLEVSAQQRKANAVLIGPAGAGKTAVAEGLALLCAEHGAVLPERIRGLKVLALDVGALVAGAGVYGEIEKRLASILDTVRGAPVLLFIDELHTLVGAGGRAGHNDVAQWLKPHLARGDIRVLAATTAEEYSQIIGRDAALERRFSPVYVKPLSAEATVRACASHARWLGLDLGLPTLRQVERQARRLMRHRAMPDAAIDLLERSAAMAELRREPLSQGLVVKASCRLLQLPEDVVQRLRRLAGRRDGFMASPCSAPAKALLALLGFARAAPTSASAVPVIIEGLGAKAAESVAHGLSGALGTEVIDVNLDAGEREIFGAEPGTVGYGQRRPIHRLLDRPFSVLLVRGLRPGQDGGRLLADLRRGCINDSEGRAIAFYVAVLAGAAANSIGFM